MAAPAFHKTTSILRTQLEMTVEQLLALLDHLDGDENLEDGGDLDFCQSEDDAPIEHLHRFVPAALRGGHGL